METHPKEIRLMPHCYMSITKQILQEVMHRLRQDPGKNENENLDPVGKTTHTATQLTLRSSLNHFWVKKRL
jgi:hypothetical protein